jgi:hypothetical protein
MWHPQQQGVTLLRREDILAANSSTQRDRRERGLADMVTCDTIVQLERLGVPPIDAPEAHTRLGGEIIGGL